MQPMCASLAVFLCENKEEPRILLCSLNTGVACGRVHSCCCGQHHMDVRVGQPVPMSSQPNVVHLHLMVLQQ